MFGKHCTVVLLCYLATIGICLIIVAGTIKMPFSLPMQAMGSIIYTIVLIQQGSLTFAACTPIRATIPTVSMIFR
uniref:CHR929 n=2 Tax=Arundo donax TaxID=35708 RepID=A0A0A8XNC1_ARUDO